MPRDDIVEKMVEGKPPKTVSLFSMIIIGFVILAVLVAVWYLCGGKG